MFGDYLKAIEILESIKVEVKECSITSPEYLIVYYKVEISTINNCINLLKKAWEDEQKKLDAHMDRMHNKEQHEMGRYDMFNSKDK